MTNSPNSSSSNPPPDSPENGTRQSQDGVVTAVANPEDSPLSTLSRTRYVPKPSIVTIADSDASSVWVILTALTITIIGLFLNNTWVGFSGAIAALIVSLRVVAPSIQSWARTTFTTQGSIKLVGFLGVLIAVASLFKFIGVYRSFSNWLAQIQWDEFGSWAEWFGALGQILIAILAVYIAWRQYVISRDLTIQQNRITQQQTIDAYFQGVSDLALNDEGLLEDWPQERAIAEGRTAAILSSVDSEGKSKILRFLSQSRLVTPLRRDQHLGRPILDGVGGYEEDRTFGLRVIHLGVMLAGANLSRTDLRWTDLSEANMVRANLSGCDLVKANLARTVLYEANLAGADLKGTRFFYGVLETASPRSRSHAPNYKTGEYTGAVVERADFSKVQRMSDEQRHYCCAWCGEKSRSTIPGGCEDVENKLGR